MKYGFIKDGTAYLYFEISEGKRTSGNIDYIDEARAIRKSPQEVITEKGLKELIVPSDFDGNASLYNYVERDNKIILAGLKSEVATKKERQADVSRISTLRTELASEDYKVIKCAEYQLNGLEMPYDLVELTASRNEKREEINSLETKWGYNK